MPKFDPKQQQKKLRRHNPIAKTSGGSTQASGASIDRPRQHPHQQQHKLPEDAIPLLTHLPTSTTHTSAPTSIEEDEKRHRALLGLNPLLLSKSSRVALLEPKHQLLQRLLAHLDHPRLEVRKEAAGCLRNLCVEGKWSGREQIWKLGGGATALAQIQYAAKELGLLPRSKDEHTQTPAPSAPESSSKAPQDMNRKERRHAAKAAAKAAQAKGAINDAQTLPAPALATPASAAAEADAHDLHLLHLSLLENHLTILWCLLESVTSPVWLISLNRSPLGHLLIAAIKQGAETFTAQQSLTPTLSKTDQKDKREVARARVEVAFTAANLLAAWLEDNPAGCAAIAGLPLELTEQVIAFEQAGSSALAGTKSRKGLDAILDKFGGEMTDQTVSAARQRIGSLTAAADLLSNTTCQTSSDLERANLGLLSLASCCNLLSPLPASIRSCVPASSIDDAAVQTLAQWQIAKAAPLLLDFLRANGQDTALWRKADADAQAAQEDAARGGGGTLPKPEIVMEGEGEMEVDHNATGDDDDDGEDEMLSSGSVSLRTAEVLTLAVDLLGEICTEAGSEEESLQAPDAQAGVEDAEAGDEDMDEGEDGDIDDDDDDDGDTDSLTSEQEEEMLMLAETDRASTAEDADAVAPDADGDTSMGATANGSMSRKATTTTSPRKLGFAANPYAVLVSDHGTAETLLDLRTVAVSSSAPPTVTTASPSVEFALALHNTLAALLSGLASHAHPPPTHPLEQGSRQARRVDQFIAWLTPQSSRMASLWTRLAACATTDLPQYATALSTSPLLPLAVPTWTSLHALMVCYEGVAAVPYPITSDTLKTFFGSSLDLHLSISTASASTTSTADAATETSSLILSQLAYLARVPNLNTPSSQLERICFSTSTYLTLLLTLKTLPLKITLTALNALIDTFSDEESEWDVPVFRQGQGIVVAWQGQTIQDTPLLDLLQDPRYNVAAALKEVIRHVDPRKDDAHRVLKEEGEEALDNFKAWIAFRQSVQ